MPNLSVEGSGVVLDDAGVFGNVGPEVGGAEVVGVGRVGPHVREGGLPPHSGNPRNGAYDGADKGDIGDLRLVVVQALGLGRAEDLAVAGLSVAPEVGHRLDGF